MIDARVGGGAVLSAKRRARVVVGQSGRRRIGIQRREAGGDRIDPTGRDHVAGERLSRDRIVDDDRNLREIAAAHPRRGHGKDIDLPLPAAEPFVVDEVERPVAHERPADASPELLLLEQRVHCGEVVARIELVIAPEAVGRAMERIGARLRENVDHAARCPPNFGGVIARLDPHFGNCVNRGANDDGADGTLVVVHPVDQHVVAVVARAVDRHRGGGPPIVGPRAAAECIRSSRVRPGHPLNEADEVPAVDRQILHLALRDEGADGGRLGLEQRRFGRHLHGLADRPDSETAVDANLLTASHGHFRFLCREPLQLNPDQIIAERQQRHEVVAGISGNRRAHVAGAEILDSNGGAGEHPAAFVGNAPDDFSRRHLRQGGGRNSQ